MRSRRLMGKVYGNQAVRQSSGLVHCCSFAVGPTGEGPDGANTNTVQSAALTIAPPPRHARFGNVIDFATLNGLPDGLRSWFLAA